jgi:DNA polymerase I
VTYAVDVYDDEVLEWSLAGDGAVVERVSDYTPTLYVAAAGGDLGTAREHVGALPAVVGVRVEQHRTGFREEPEPVLRVDVAGPGAVRSVARTVAGWGAPGDYRPFNVDLTRGFRYCLERGVEPVPEGRRLRTLRLAADEPALAEEAVTELTVGGEPVTGSPAEVAAAVDERVARADPDVLVCAPARLVPRLHEQGDDGVDLSRLPAADPRAGCDRLAERSTYTSYGRVGHSPARYNLAGRMLVDEANTFLWTETNLAGCLDLVSRSGKPLQELSWASIGNVLTAIQVRAARQRDVLVPWRSWRHERFKTMGQLHAADRGGHVVAPEVGVHEDVHELDFGSLYPNVMVTRNLSPETVRCDCHDTADVPELGYSVCPEPGYLPEVLEPLIADRAAMKGELASATDPEHREALQGQVDAIKWILVSCFGYQGFSNAKFGRIECHEAINAHAREILLRAKERLERAGWRVLHGIVDSVWVTAREGEPQRPLSALCAELSEAVDVPLEYEAAFDWVAFVPRREDDAGALTKYFGRRREPGAADRYKLRGIECRQRSTAPFVADAQETLVAAFDEHRDPAAVCDRLQRFLADLTAGAVDPAELVVEVRVSKPREAYDRDTRTTAALERAAAAGIDVHPGQSTGYVVVDDDRSGRDRVRLAGEAEGYDAGFYRDRLLRAAESVLAPAGWRRGDIEAYLADRTDAAIGAYTT